jgi:hypothetical protein
MVEYRKFVATLATENSNQTFLNSDEDHAAVVFEQIFKDSKSELRIFAGSLCSKVANSPAYIEALSGFLERGGKLNILLNNYNPECAKNSNVFKRLAYYISEGKSISIKRTTSKPYFANDPGKKEIHFTVGDDKSYRIETDIESRTAECNLNNPNIAKIYIEFFDKKFAQDNAPDINISELFK